jgi:hypothetical protein
LSIDRMPLFTFSFTNTPEFSPSERRDLILNKGWPQISQPKYSNSQRGETGAAQLMLSSSFLPESRLFERIGEIIDIKLRLSRKIRTFAFEDLSFSL